jgi:uncharacterized membrane protein/osmotically-inducible protein OsmY
MNRPLESMKDNRFALMNGLGVGALGALLMYVFDPQIGRRRRALARDKAIRIAHKTFDAIDVTARDLKNRAVGVVAKTRNLVSEEDLSDEMLEQRVRSKLGSLVSHPSSIEVKAENGKVTFSGTILADEVERLLSRVSSMREVKAVDSQLEVHHEPGNIPGLQGQPAQRKTGETPDIMQASWSPATRFIAGTAGGTLALYGLRQLNAFGAAVSALGTAVLARALTNMEFKRLIGIGAGRRAVTIHKIINVAAPVEQVFAFWSNYQNFPRFMSNVRQIQETGNSRSHWVVAGPGGVPVEWNAVVTNYVPNQSLGWKTAPGSPIAHAGMVRFEPNPDGSTRVEVRMTYNPVAGALGHTVASLFGADPKSEMDADLMRMKSMIETGVPAHDAVRKDGGEAYTH